MSKICRKPCLLKVFLVCVENIPNKNVPQTMFHCPFMIDEHTGKPAKTRRGSPIDNGPLTY